MRIVDDTEAREAKCPVVDFKIKDEDEYIKVFTNAKFEILTDS